MSERSIAQLVSSRWSQRPAGTWLAITLALLLLLGHWLYGGQRSEAGMILVIMSGLLLGGALLQPGLRADLSKVRRLGLCAVLYGAVLAAVGWSLTAWAPGGPHPVWAYLGSSEGRSAVDPSATIVELVKLFSWGGFFVIGSILGSTDRRAHLSLTLIFYSSALYGLWMFIAFVGGDPEARFAGRLSGHFLSANTAATLMAVTLCLGLALTLRQLRQAPRSQRLTASLPAATFSLFAFAALLCTASRAGTVAAVAGVLLILAAEGRRRGVRKSRFILLAGAMLVALLVLTSLAGDHLLERYFAVSKDAQARQLLTRVHWEAFLASPINGYGLGSFDAVNRVHLGVDNFARLWSVNSVHNVYVQWLSEGGLAAALPMFFVIGAVMIAAVMGAFRRERMTGWLFALLACDLVVLLHGWTDFALQTPSFAALWAVLLGVQFALAQGLSRVSRRSEPSTLFSTAGAGVAAAASVAGGLLVLAALQSGAAQVGRFRLLELARGYDVAAERALQEPGGAADLDRAERASRRAAAISPYDTAAWLRLAYIDAARNGRLSPRGAEYIDTTYNLVAFDPDVARWRVRFGLEHWPELTKEGRKGVEAEAKLLLNDEAHRSYALRDLKSISSPSGRMIASFWLNPIGGPKR